MIYNIFRCLKSGDIFLNMERHIYILRLGERKWYVGVTNDIEARAWEHATGNGAAWTTHYGIQGLESHHLEMDEMDETNTTLAMMMTYGIENVRGGPWTRMSITPADIEDQSLIMRHVRNACMRCGATSHYVNTCFAKRSWDEFDIKDQSLIMRRVRNACMRCGATSHHVNTCFAKRSWDEFELKENSFLF